MEPLSGINRTIHEIRKKDKKYSGNRSFGFGEILRADADQDCMNKCFEML
jgi:hypothetical protein